jgi:hypothetical protein
MARLRRGSRTLFVAVFTSLVIVNVWLWVDLLSSNGTGNSATSVEATIAIAIGSLALAALYLAWRHPVLPTAFRMSTPSLRFALATHQAGHIVATFLQDPNRLGKVQLAGPCAPQTSPVPTMTQQAMRDELAITLSGIAAEEIFTGESSAHAAADLARTTELGADMVGRFGMTGSLVSLATGRIRRSRFMEKVLEDARARKELEALLRDSKRDSMRSMLENRHLIITIRDELLRREQLTPTDIQLLFDEARSRRENADEVLVDLRAASERTRPFIGLAKS